MCSRGNKQAMYGVGLMAVSNVVRVATRATGWLLLAGSLAGTDGTIITPTNCFSISHPYIL